MEAQVRSNHYKQLTENLCFIELKKHIKFLQLVANRKRDAELTDNGSILNREYALGAESAYTDLLTFIDGDLRTGGEDSPQNETEPEPHRNEYPAE